MSETTTQTQAVEPAKKAALTLRQHLDSDAFRSAIQKALPRHMTAERFLRIAITATIKTPKLLQCETASVLQSLLTCSQLGIEPDQRRAHLIPYEDRKRGITICQLIIDWKGLSELIFRSGLVSTLHADVIHEGDMFAYDAGRITTHIPHFLRRDAEKPAEAGKPIGAFATATMRDGCTKAEVMSFDQVEAIRLRSRAGKSGPWVTDWSEMAKKTAFRRLSKWLPLSPELRDAVEADDALDIQATPVATAGLDALMISAGDTQGEEVSS